MRPSRTLPSIPIHHTWPLRPARAMALAALVGGPLCAMAAPDVASFKGLLHSAAEQARLQLVLTTQPLPPVPAQPRPHDVRLDAILYIAPDNWVIWVNGRMLRNGEQDADVHVLGVTPGAVRLTVPAGPDAGRQPAVVLRPLQSWLVNTGRILDHGEAGTQRNL